MDISDSVALVGDHEDDLLDVVDVVEDREVANGEESVILIAVIIDNDVVVDCVAHVT